MRHSSKTALTHDLALAKAASYCATAEHCVAEVRDKLVAWGTTDTDTENILRYLLSEKYIDEQRYCTAFVRDKFRFNRWGKIKIAMMLRSKKMTEDAIESALAQLDDTEYTDALTALLTTKNRSLKCSTNYERKLKLARFAQSRGFELDIAMAIIEKII